MKRFWLAAILCATLLHAQHTQPVDGSVDNGESLKSEALQGFFELAKSGDLDAQTMLGELYLDGLNGVEKDPQKAFFWISKAANREEPQAQYLLGYMYENGIHVAKDVKKAVRWYKKSAMQGDVLAQYNLALIYKEGKGNVSKNINEAFKWIQMVQKEERRVEQVAMRMQ